MIVKVSGADPIFIAGSIYLSMDGSNWWLLIIPLVISGFFFEPRWDRKTGWRFRHGE